MKNATLNWLRKQCSDNLLTEKWLLCDSLRTAQTWKDRINLTGTATANLHPKTLRSVVLSLISDHLATSKLLYLGQSPSESLMQGLIESELEAGSLKYFAVIEHTDGLAKLAVRSIRDLRLACISPKSLGSSDFESSAKADDLKLLYQRYLEVIRQRSLVDYADCLDLAIQELNRGSCEVPTDLLVLWPHPVHLTWKEQRFAASLKACARIVNPDMEPSRELMELDQPGISFFSGYGEINEVRAVIQRIAGNDLSTAVRLDDVEIIYTDDSYVPLIYEFLEEHAPTDHLSGKDAKVGPPVTFSDGIASIYSRPGRALRAWLRWINSNGPQSKAVQMVREGVLNRPEEKNRTTPIGYSRLAANLRRISIGFKLNRYVPAIESAIAQAKNLQREFMQRRDHDDGDDKQPADSHDDEVPRDFGLPALNTLLAIVKPAVELAPSASDCAASVLQKAKRFLLQCARCENKLDRYARRKLLDDIDARLISLEYAEESIEGIIAWLEDLPMESPILGSGPQPGCVHAAPIGRAGFSGRRHVFVVGMDSNRIPKPTRVDPLLLDAERQSISAELETSTQLLQRNAKQLTEVIQRVTELEDARVSFSFSTRNLVEDRDQSPSPTLVEIFRRARGLPDANLKDLQTYLGQSVSFASQDPGAWLCPSDGNLTDLLTTIGRSSRQSKLESHFPHFRSARFADQRRQRPEFTEFDGHVAEAGPELAPTNSERVSPSRLEAYGTCPRRFFFKYGLGVYPPDQWDVDLERWLDPITLGNLVHGLFEKFMRELTQRDLIPDLDRDLPRLLGMLDDDIRTYLNEFPSPNEDALQRQKDWLTESCEIFLEKEQVYCRETGARPWVLEAAIGLDEEPNSPLDCRDPIVLSLKDGQVIRLGGRIDRVDRLNIDGSESYAIWDYKSGSDWGFSQGDPFKQGRKLQSFLYVGMLRHRLAAIGKDKSAAMSFGYFFPNAKTQGRRMQWTAGELKQGDTVLQNICDLIKKGIFPATTDSSDCKFCDYKTVCQDTDFVAAESVRQAAESQNNEFLGTWKMLRDL